VRYRGEKILLTAPQFGVVTNRARHDGHAGEQHYQDKRFRIRSNLTLETFP
jgi:hypothetical protein